VKYELPNAAKGRKLSATWPGRGSDTISYLTACENELPKSVVGLEPVATVLGTVEGLELGATWSRIGLEL
jgi:hypothetical protein